MSIIKVLAFEGERYSINWKTKNGNAECYVDKEEGIRVSESIKDGIKTIVVSIGSVEEILFGIEIFAHPIGNYELTIKKD